MFYALLIIHILASVLLILIVLLQTGRGAELGAAFGGMGQATYGRGQSTAITKITTVLAVIFMSTSLSLAFLTTEQPTQSVIQPGLTPAAETSSTPAASVPASAASATGTTAQPAAGSEAFPPPSQGPVRQTDAPPPPSAPRTRN